MSWPKRSPYHAEMRSLIGCLLTFALMSDATAAEAVHDRSYWQGIIRGGYAVPAGESAFELVRELNALLGSPDPELRDHLAYRIVGVWVSGGAPFTKDELTKLQDEWQANLRDGVGRVGSDAVLKRSFSALCLAALVERDLKERFLEPQRYRELLAAALEYLAAERDLRGFDERRGWVHATAHTADLLAELSKHPQLTAEDQGRVLAGVSSRLTSAPEVFTQGEQDRLAQVIAALFVRPDFDATRFDAWLETLIAAKRQAARTSPLTPAALAAYQNSTYFLQALHARLSMARLEGAAAKSRTGVLDTLR